MPHLQQTSLQTRLIMGMATMLMPLVALAGGAVICFESAFNAFEKTENETLENLFPLTHLESLIVKAAIPAEKYLVSGDLSQRDRFLQLSQEVNNTFAAITAIPSELTEKKVLVQASQKEWQQIYILSKVIFAHPAPQDKLIALQEMTQLQEQTSKAVESIKRLYNLLNHWQTADNLAQAQSIKHTVRLIISSVFGLGLGVAGIAGLMLSRSILLPIRVLETGVDRLGEGNLSHRIDLATSDELGQLAVAFNLMAEKLEHTQVELQNLATLDGLTGVYNRREFNRRLKTELERSQRYGHFCSLLMIDIDYFKKLNDTYGHQAGDEVLRTTAVLIKQQVRPTDQVARYGGEEFAVILPETSKLAASKVAERLRQAIASQAISITEAQTINITFSGGIASFPEDAGSEERLIYFADQALYTAKQSGRNRVVSSNAANQIK